MIELGKISVTNLDELKKTLPLIHFLKDQIPYMKLPSMYKGADAFVLATHGEGWGLPIIEAMSMQLPAISTNWSGSTEFMNEQNSFPIPVPSLIKAILPGHQWAQPSFAALKLAMRNVFENRREAMEIGRVARSNVVEQFSQEKVAEKVLDKILAIVKSKAELVNKKETKKKELSKKKGKEKEQKQSKITIKIVDDK